MTEEQAKTKWCPMVRVFMSTEEGAAAASVNSTQKLEHTRCIASGCMMWRWTKVPEQVRVRDEIHMSNGEGYCGLAGHQMEHQI